MNLLDQIKQADGFNEETISIKEWGFDVKLKEPMSGEIAAARKKYVKYTPSGDADISKTDTEMLNYAMLSLCVVDEDGSRVFESAKLAQEVLSTKSARIVAQIIRAAGKLCGEEVGAAEKN